MQYKAGAILKKIFNFLKSTKLAVTLIILLISLFLTATLIPQVQDETFYLTHYPDFIAWLIIQTHYHNFYHSYFFLVPLCLFFINLSACTFGRIIRRFIKKAPLRFGPDLIHLSILMFISIGIFSLQQQAQEITVAVGEETMLPFGYRFEIFEETQSKHKTGFDLPAFNYQLKRDNVTVAQGSLLTDRPIELNGFFIQNLQYSIEERIILKQGKADYYELKPGLGFINADGHVIFTGIEKVVSSSDLHTEKSAQEHSLMALFTTKQENGAETVLMYKKSDKLGPFLLYDIFYSYSIRFLLKQDTVSLYILFAGGLFLGGLALTFLQKKGDKKL